MRPYIFKLMDAARDEAARFSAWVKARGLAADDWITLSGRDSNGDKHGGARVLLDDSGAIVYGLGGGHAGKKLGDALHEIKVNAAAQRGQGLLFSDMRLQARKERKQAKAEKEAAKKQRQEDRKAAREAARKSQQQQTQRQNAKKELDTITQKKVALLENEIRDYEERTIPEAERRLKGAEFEYNRAKSEYERLKGVRGEKKAEKKFKDAEYSYNAARSYYDTVKSRPDSYRGMIKQLKGEEEYADVPF